MAKLYITNDQNKKYLISYLIKQNILNIKVMGYQEFIKKYYFDYNEQTLYYLMTHYNLRRDIAKFYVDNMYYLEDNVKSPRIDFLKKLYQELKDNDLLIFNPYFSSWLKNYEVTFYHINIKDSFYLKTKDSISLITTVLEEDTPNKNYQVVTYKKESIDEEVAFVCDKIVSLIKKGISPNDIYLTNLNENYRLLFQKYGEIFHLQFNFNVSKNVYSTHLIQDFLTHLDDDLEEYLTKVSLNLKNEEDKKIYEALINELNNLPSLKMDNNLKKYIQEKIKNLTVKPRIYQNCINELALLDSEIDENSYIFLVGANDSEFPKTYEEKYFNKEERWKLGLDSKITMDKKIYEETSKRVFSYPNLYVTYTKDLSKVFQNNSLSLDESFTYLNSHLFNKIIYGREYDVYRKSFFISPIIQKLYGTYNKEMTKFDNSYHLVNIKNINTKLSYSSIILYQKCPYRFYLANILKVRAKSDTLAIYIGNLYHEVLENYYQDNFDYASIIQKYQKNSQLKTFQEKYFFQKLITNLEDFLKVLKSQEENLNYEKVLCEEKIKVSLKDDFYLEGIIDKMYVLDKNIAIVDYKTGSFDTDMSLVLNGLNLQLPIYIYLLKNSQYHDYSLMGFYYQKVGPVLLKDKSTDKELINNFKLDGYSINSEEVISSFDKSYQDSKVIKSMKVSEKGFYYYTKIYNEDELLNLIDIVQDILNKTVDNILNNHFPIAPKKVGEDLLGCKFCPYKNICYLKEEDIVYLPKHSKEAIFGKNKEEKEMIKL